MKTVAPNPDLRSFTCPHCHSYAQHYTRGYNEEGQRFAYSPSQKFFQIISKCQACGEVTIWVKDTLYYPLISTAPPAHQSMPEDVKATYAEAA